MNDHSSRRTITHTLKRPTRIQHGPCLRIPIWSCFWWGLPCRELLPDTRCALTAPFHPYLPFLRKETIRRRSTLCCTCRRFTPPRRYLAPCPTKPGLSSPVSITEIYTAAIVWLTSGRMLPNFLLNCLCFFEQLTFYIYPLTHLGFPHDQDRSEYSQQDKIMHIAVDQNDLHIQYTNLDGFHKSLRP